MNENIFFWILICWMQSIWYNYLNWMLWKWQQPLPNRKFGTCVWFYYVRNLIKYQYMYIKKDEREKRTLIILNEINVIRMRDIHNILLYIFATVLGDHSNFVMRGKSFVVLQIKYMYICMCRHAWTCGSVTIWFHASFSTIVIIIIIASHSQCV